VQLVQPARRLELLRTLEHAHTERWHPGLAARKVLGWPKRRKLAHAFPWEYMCKRLKLAQFLGRHGAFLACSSRRCAAVEKTAMLFRMSMQRHLRR
jgi:hypothetical protein